MKAGGLSMVMAGVAAIGAKGAAGCVAPGRCVPPNTTYSSVLPVGPRQQWNLAGEPQTARALRVGLDRSKVRRRRARVRGDGGRPEMRGAGLTRAVCNGC